MLRTNRTYWTYTVALITWMSERGPFMKCLLLGLAIGLIAGMSGLCTAQEPGEGRDGSLDNGGSFCLAATIIPGATTHYVDSGMLDGDNDCSAPFPTPYNEVFYKFTPTDSRDYIFRLRLSAPATSVSLRIQRDACCSGGIMVAAETTRVAGDCDGGATTYTRASLIAGVQYWIQVGNNRPARCTAAYDFELMHVECPQEESAQPHDSPITAQRIACNDSVMGDSAWAGHADYYKFTLPFDALAYDVEISEDARAFGHCTSGCYPHATQMALDACFTLICGRGYQVGCGENEGCSTDARLRFCLPAGDFIIKVENHGGGFVSAWPYILTVKTQPSVTMPNDTLLWECGIECCSPCIGNPATTELNLNGLSSAPSDSACVHFRPDLGQLSVPLIVLVFDDAMIPVFSAHPGCCDGSGTPVSNVQLDVSNLHYVATPTPRYVGARVFAGVAEVGCEACVKVEFIARGLEPTGMVIGSAKNVAGITRYALHPNYPNPFNPSTTISFDLPQSSTVSLKVYNVMGREVATLADSYLSEGRHTVAFDGSRLPSGLYICRMQSDGYVAETKMLLMK
jgi:hypothetical protein